MYGRDLIAAGKSFSSLLPPPQTSSHLLLDSDGRQLVGRKTPGAQANLATIFICVPGWQQVSFTKRFLRNSPVVRVFA